MDRREPNTRWPTVQRDLRDRGQETSVDLMEQPAHHAALGC